MTFEKKHLLLVMAGICLALYFYGTNLPEIKVLRPLGYLCLGLGGMLNLITN